MNNYKKEIVEHIFDNINSYTGTTVSELHNNLFNNDYYIIGRYEAEQWLTKGPGVFQAIGEIKEYEENNFGEVTTDLSESERVVNMYVYILGEKIMNECTTINDNWDNELTDEMADKIKDELVNIDLYTI